MSESMFIGKMLRWMAWATLWTIYHPELARITSWGTAPLVVAESVLMYILSGVLLELTYNKLRWGEFVLRPSGRRGSSPIFAVNSPQ